ncbi:hypothetical protein [Legionella oakridgensis]|uniref:Uncharacterized protein n=2 Tax=Legionella oakridgensis TaxID=29423 RepID=W0BAI5_9GAMM|nr:hypothetical protein [Legionella oakridgensis]AHE67553.1 hypothetical protein Loa_02009 [Legionella oakridgensis ATCC 33761 = DSM 21215]ETO92799.1 hypothetical protein LOR_61c14530 [Legionella oakridgensis RV-2-2007]KTD37095.1 hypothetical protein Loak_2231 [Legionella oakridgensis]STY20596.1 Uncharacterised protein [Legionella longbeachae]
MKKILIYICLYFVTSAALAYHIVLDNKTNYPTKDKPGKIAVQWAASVDTTQKANQAIMNGSELELSSLMTLSQTGPIQLTPPQHAQYFRIVVWSTDKQEPDLLTNWVNIVSNKTYVVNQDHLIPTVLISGAGC